MFDLDVSEVTLMRRVARFTGASRGNRCCDGTDPAQRRFWVIVNHRPSARQMAMSPSRSAEVATHVSGRQT
jgi:hypothetical protein